MIISPGVRAIGDTFERLIGFDQFYGFGSLTPNMIGEHEIVSLFWRTNYCQLVVRGEAPEDLFEKITIHLPNGPFELASFARYMFSPTVHGDTCWTWIYASPGAHSGDFSVEIV